MPNPCQCQFHAPDLGSYSLGCAVAAYKPSSLTEQHAAAMKQLDEVRDEARMRRHAVSLAVRASDGSEDDLLALATLFEAWQLARKVGQATAEHVASLESAMKAEKEAKSNG